MRQPAKQYAHPFSCDRATASTPDGTVTGEGVRVLLRSEEHTSELQSQSNLVCRLLLAQQKDARRRPPSRCRRRGPPRRHTPQTRTATLPSPARSAAPPPPPSLPLRPPAPRLR